jgi:tetratricopeptide (TPR) repeat protein
MIANRIVQHIFQEPDIKQVDETALERLVSSYPYFTAARLLLARKQYTVQKNLLAPAVKKAQQYSNNMHYFYRFVTTDEKSLVVEEAPVVPPPPADIEEEVVVAFPGQEPEADEPEAFAEPDEDEEDPVTAPETATLVEEMPVTLRAATPAQEAPAVPVPEAKIHVTVPKTPVTAIPETPAADTTAAPSPAIPPANANASPANQDTEPIKIFPLDTSETETSLTFQPLYTDDYFAYKRLKEPEQAEQLSEKAAAEMKSFTSWLKEMKHTFAEKASKQWYHQQMHRSYEDADPEVSEAVEKMAMESITLNDDIVSETLAEIWARQHQYQTAIHIYQKLSLLNPNKSAYFAQKIKELQLLTEKS